MKYIVIINGVMGVIGSPIFSYFVEKGENIVWGISRKGLYFEEYLDKKEKIQKKNLVFSLTDYKNENYHLDIDNFIESMPNLPVIFIHAMGEFVTEITRNGELMIKNDKDSDGINDSVKRLTYEAPIYFAKKLSERKTKTLFVQIGSLSDKHRIEVHGSWVKSMELLKEDLNVICKKHKNFNSLILNVSSVLTPKELIDRPFVSIKTDADMRYWLPPTEIASFIDEYSQDIKPGFFEDNLYKKWPNISSRHFDLVSYKTRRKLEIFDDLSYKYKDVLSLDDGDSIEYNFKNPFSLDRVWGDLTVLLSRLHNKNKPVFFFNPHNWFFIVRNKAENEIFSSIEKEGIKIFLTCGSDTKLDKSILKEELKKYNHQYRINNKLNFDNNYNLNIYNDFIIEVMIDKNIADLLDIFYKKNNSITKENSTELREIISKNGKNKLTIYRNNKKSEKLQSILIKDFLKK